MSWQTYVDSTLVGSGHLDKAALYSAAGDSQWAASAGFDMKPEEALAIVNILNNTGNARNEAYGNGVYVGGSRYVLARAEDDGVYARQGRTGIVAAKTSQVIIIGHHGEAQIAGNATQVVQQLADYLAKNGY